MRTTNFEYLGVTLRLFEAADFRKALELGFTKKQLSEMRKANRVYNSACRENGKRKDSVLRDRKVGKIHCNAGNLRDPDLRAFSIKGQDNESHGIFSGASKDYATRPLTPKDKRIGFEKVSTGKDKSKRERPNGGIDSPKVDTLHLVSNECVQRAERFPHDTKVFRPVKIAEKDPMKASTRVRAMYFNMAETMEVECETHTHLMTFRTEFKGDNKAALRLVQALGFTLEPRINSNNKSKFTMRVPLSTSLGQVGEAMVSILDNDPRFANDELHRCFQTLSLGKEPNEEWYM